jgi:alkanesulfonate monooxygenase SsuD/methylene tetrahydromethanopterin reductase-like flavin-dependent oxidoreductase (luciferase family)
MVSPLSFRPPALLIKAVSTLAVLSDGRAWLDVGAGYLQDEADAMGLTMPPVAECSEELEETLQFADRMWPATMHPSTGSAIGWRARTAARCRYDIHGC